MEERKANLTKRTLDALKPAALDYQIWDTKVRGLGVRVYPSGARGFVLQYRNAAGRTRKIALGRYGVLTVDKAREKATRLLAAILDGQDPSQDKRESRHAKTVGELADLYLREGSIDKPNKKLSSLDGGRGGSPAPIGWRGSPMNQSIISIIQSFESLTSPFICGMAPFLWGAARSCRKAP